MKIFRRDFSGTPDKRFFHEVSFIFVIILIFFSGCGIKGMVLLAEAKYGVDDLVPVLGNHCAVVEANNVTRGAAVHNPSLRRVVDCNEKGISATEMKIKNDIKVTNLRCEYRINPLGIDIVKPRLFWCLESEQRGQKQTGYQILVASNKEKLKNNNADIWDSGKVKSNQSIHVEYAGKTLKSKMQCYWKVRVWDKDGKVSSWSEPAMWSMGLLADSEWGAKWIAPSADKLMAPIAGDWDSKYSISPLPYFRKSFSVNGKCRRATAYVTGLGLYHLYVNGQRVGDDVFAPEWTVYRNRIQYRTFDVTDIINSGANAIGVIIGSGWYGDFPIFAMPQLADRFLKGQPGLILRLDIEMEDGRFESVVTDESWRYTTDGPIRFSSLYNGEIYDGRMEMPGWNEVGFDDSKWDSAILTDFAGTNLVWQPDDPIRITKELKPVNLIEPEPGVYVFDLGQNMVGWCRLRVKGARGSEIIMRHGEWTTDDGNLYTDNLSKALQTDKFILSGHDVETLEPHFTYHGFRYVEIRGLPEKPKLNDLVGYVFHNDLPIVGRFESSNNIINKLMKNIKWSLRGNLMGTPTDCPQRNERAGWMGDMQSFSQTAMFNMGMGSFFSKWTKDIRDSQGEDGTYSEMSPMQEVGSGGPGWSDAGTIVPWRVYLNYADKRIIQEHYESAKRWVDLVHSNNPNLIWKNKRGGDWGDWLNGDTLTVKDWPKSGGEVPKDLFATAFFAHSTEIVSKMAALIGREDDMVHYGTLFEDIKEAFNKEFVKLDGRMAGNTQAGYALALRFNLLPEELRDKAIGYIVKDIERYNGHFSTGIHATHRLMLELTRNGRHDVACNLMNLRTVPSWGYTIDNGATTIWERWDGRVKNRGTSNKDQFKVGDPIPGMNSFNHYVLGSVGEWVWRNIVGINPDEAVPGYKHFTLRPRLGCGLTWAKGSYDSIHGKIVSDWLVENGKFQWKVTVPVNTTATVYVPTKDAESVKENGQIADQAPGVQLKNFDAEAAVYEVNSGCYSFVSDIHERL
jgi:alpha-L-rhamnosidase